MDNMMQRLRDDQRGITTAVVAICLVAFFGAAMLTLDAGNVWTTRRSIITGTDAAVLDAATLFNSGAASPCPDVEPGRTFANQHATDVLHQNQAGAIHDVLDPSLFEVTLADSSICTAGGYTPGKVRYDGRLTAQGFFSKMFGFGNVKPYSSSTAAWGYTVAIGRGLRPIALCDKTDNYEKYVQYWNGPGQPMDPEYDLLWGTDQGDGTSANPGLYPHTSVGFPSGDAEAPPNDKANPNFGLAYVDPATDPRFHTVHRVINPNPECGLASANKDWVDLRGYDANGTVGAFKLEDWIRNGYPGSVSLTPHDCGQSNSNTNEDCGSAPGNRNSLQEPLNDITCPATTPAPECSYIFPILVVSCVGEIVDGACVQGSGTGGENAHYVHTAFLFVVMRGFGHIDANTDSIGFDFEFTDVQTSGDVAGAPPVNAQTYQTGTQLCGADHESTNHCPF